MQFSPGTNHGRGSIDDNATRGINWKLRPVRAGINPGAYHAALVIRDFGLETPHRHAGAVISFSLPLSAGASTNFFLSASPLRDVLEPLPSSANK